MIPTEIVCTCEIYFLSLQVLASVSQFIGLALDQALDQEFPKRFSGKQRGFTGTHTLNMNVRQKQIKPQCTAPVSHKTLILAEMTEEAGIIQVHHSMLLPANVHIYRQPAIC